MRLCRIYSTRIHVPGRPRTAVVHVPAKQGKAKSKQLFVGGLFEGEISKLRLML